MTTDQLRAEVHAIVDLLSHDELRVFRFNGRRVIDIGHAKYGPLDLSNDKRDWKRERAEEAADGVFFYEALVQIAEADREQERKQRRHCEQADRTWQKLVGPDGFNISPPTFVMQRDGEGGGVVKQVAELVHMKDEGHLPEPQATYEIRDGKAWAVLK